MLFDIIIVYLFIYELSWNMIGLESDDVTDRVSTVYFQFKFNHKQQVFYFGRACYRVPGLVLYLEVVFIERRFFHGSGYIIYFSI